VLFTDRNNLDMNGICLSIDQTHILIYWNYAAKSLKSVGFYIDCCWIIGIHSILSFYLEVLALHLCNPHILYHIIILSYYHIIILSYYHIIILWLFYEYKIIYTSSIDEDILFAGMSMHIYYWNNLMRMH